MYLWIVDVVSQMYHRSNKSYSSFDSFIDQYCIYRYMIEGQYRELTISVGSRHVRKTCSKVTATINERCILCINTVLILFEPLILSISRNCLF